MLFEHFKCHPTKVGIGKQIFGMCHTSMSNTLDKIC